MRALASQWFLLSLATVLFVGVCRHESLAALADRVPRDVLVAAIMLLMSAPLDLSRAIAGVGPLRAAAIGVAINAALAPPLAWVFAQGLPDAIGVGLIVAAIAPCTLASAAVWTRRGGGNEAVALLITVVTNLGCFAILPAWAMVLLGREQSFDAAGMAWRLLLIVVAPILVGQMLRRTSVVRDWCDRRRAGLAVGAQIGLLGMVFVGATRCGRLLADPADPSEFGAASAWSLLAASVGLHVALFAAGWVWARGAGCDARHALPAAVGGSQKTLAVGLDVAIGIGGLAVLPMIVYHAAQLLVDAVLVDWLRPQRRALESGLDTP